MKESKECPFFRRPENLGFGKGSGYCDMDASSANCDADIKFCEKPDPLKQYLIRKSSNFEAE